jgi:chromate reductase
MNIQILSGTNRPGSNTHKVAYQVQTIYKKLGIDAQLIDLNKLPQNAFTSESYETWPNGFQLFSDAIMSADGVVIVMPEYNGSFPGALKYFIDMLEHPTSFQNRPVCFIGLAAGQWGALRAVEQFQQIIGYRYGVIFPERVFMPAIQNLLDETGRIKDAEMQERLEKQAQGFTEFVRQLAPTLSKT